MYFWIFLTWIQDPFEPMYAVFHTSVSLRLEQSDININISLIFYPETGSRTSRDQISSGSNFDEFHLLN